MVMEFHLQQKRSEPYTVHVAIGKVPEILPYTDKRDIYVNLPDESYDISSIGEVANHYVELMEENEWMEKKLKENRAKLRLMEGALKQEVKGPTLAGGIYIDFDDEIIVKKPVIL